MNKPDLKAMLTEDEISQFADKVLKRSIQVITDELSDAFYLNMKDYLSDHHENFQNEIFHDVFRFICGAGWTQYKDKYDAKELRKILFEEHKEYFMEALGPFAKAEYEKFKTEKETLQKALARSRKQNEIISQALHKIKKAVEV